MTKLPFSETHRGVVAARFHPAEYRIHKYWARKPHNVLRSLIEEYSRPTDLIVDPFCGSGVFLVEGAFLGRNVVGFDLNPIAVLISKVSLNPPSSSAFEAAARELIDALEARFISDYQVRTPAGTKELHHCVHAVVVECPSCSEAVRSIDAVKEGRRYLCPHCSQRLSFNLAELMRTEIIDVVLEGNDSAADEFAEEQATKILSRQQEAAYEQRKIDKSLQDKYSLPFLKNIRILAFEDMETVDLFTPRAFRVIGSMADEIHQWEDQSTRDSLMMFLTASMVQCSRLIPYRDNLRSGGPGWTVPGFWVPPVHIETNPFNHFRSRLSRFSRGLDRLAHRNTRKHTAKSVYCKDAQSGLSDLGKKDDKAKIIFLDPPYGDNVPYLEFSTIWNSVIGETIKYERELIVSDRDEVVSGWDSYARDMSEMMGECRNLIHDDGRLVITFNNLEPQAWHALLASLEGNDFEPSEVLYQIPAVVSTKAQLAKSGSYIGDFYCIYKPSKTSSKRMPDAQAKGLIAEAGARALAARGGVAKKVVILRAMLYKLLELNVNPGLVLEIEDVISSIATENDGTLRQNNSNVDPNLLLGDHELLATIATREAFKRLKGGGKCEWKELYEDIARSSCDIGIPSIAEVRTILDEFLIFNGKMCELSTNHRGLEGLAALNEAAT